NGGEEKEEDEGEEKEEKKGKRGSKGGEKADPKAIRLTNLKKIAHRANLRFVYKKIFANCTDKDSARVRELEKQLEMKGFEKPHTLERASEYRLAKETQAELEELRRNCIITAETDDPKVRVTRSRRSAPAPVEAPEKKKSRRAAIDSSDDEDGVKKEANEDEEEDEESSEDETEKDPFANLKDIIGDGEDSD
ncbi:hypothetical protein PFISCL1PPCAC_9060, partial [Pristionchus fissidentatus]